MTAQPNQQVTFFIDRCLGSKIIVQSLRSSGINVEIHDDHFGQSALDVDWLPEVAKRGWIILTKDARIGKNQTERLAVANANIKMFALACQNLPGKKMADIFVQSINKMQEFAFEHNAPFIAKVYRDGRVKMWKDAVTLLEEINNLKSNKS